MQILNHHKWIKLPTGFRSYVCQKCGCERLWDNKTQRYIYTKYWKSYFFVPECNILTDKQWK